MYASSFDIQYLQLPSKQIRILYVVVLAALMLGISLLPFLYVDVGISAPGLLQGISDKIDLVAPASGHLTYVNLTENQKVHRGQTLIQLDDHLNKIQNETNAQQQGEVRHYLQDLARLIRSVPDSGFREGTMPELSTTLYRAIWDAHKQTLQQHTALALREKQHFDRQKQLYSKSIISREEFEQHNFRYEKVRLEEKALIRSFKSQWQQEIVRHQTSLSLLREKNGVYKAQEKMALLSAPAHGTLQHTVTLYPGTFIAAQQKIGELIPESSIIAYCYVSPENIGHIRKGQPVRLHIKAFNIHSQGTISAKAGEIPANVMFKNDIPFFKIPCIPDKNYLQLKNGDKRLLKKGMTCRAHFIVARRSLFQLLYDRVEDWLKP